MNQTGALPDPKDERDFKIASFFRRPSTAPLPSSIDYSNLVPIIRNQLSLGSCVGFAATEMKTAQEATELRAQYQFSPLFIYWLRENMSEGMYLRDAMKILREYGVCEEYLLNYQKNLRSRGTLEKFHFNNAKYFKIDSYARISTVDEMRRALVETGPFIISIPVYESFHAVGPDGKIPIPDTSKETFYGGHALVVVGYNDEERYFKIKNSWGESWGNRGFGYLPYEFVEQYLWDAWTAVDGKSTGKNIFSDAINFLWFLWYIVSENWYWVILVTIALGIIVYAYLTGRIVS